MECKGCKKQVAWHWSGLCGSCAGDFNPANTTAPANPSARMNDSLRREAAKNEARDAARDRREMRDADLFVPFSEDGKADAARLAADRNALPTDQYGNVLDGGEMD